MDLNLLSLFDFQVTHNGSHISCRLKTKQGDLLSVAAGGITYSHQIPASQTRPTTVDTYANVEVAFVTDKGEFIFPSYLPLGFPMWDGSIFPYVPVSDVCSLLPVVYEGFKYKKGMVVKENEFLYTLDENEVEGSDKITAINPEGEYCVMNKKSMRLYALNKRIMK